MTKKSLNLWLSEYGESHKNKYNILLHKICVPLIFFSLLGLLWDWPLGPIRLAYIMILLCLPFYFSLGIKALVVILPQLLISIGVLHYFFNVHSAWPVCLTIFVLAWIGQFIGHKIEGKKPSFFEDLKYLLIGPLWVFLYK